MLLQSSNPKGISKVLWQLLTRIINGQISFDEGYGGANIMLPQGWVEGDLLVGIGPNQATRLGVGTSGDILTSDGTIPEWAAGPSPPPIASLIIDVFTPDSSTQDFTLSTTPGGAVIVVWNNLVRVPSEYTITGTALHTDFTALTGDNLFAIHL